MSKIYQNKNIVGRTKDDMKGLQHAKEGFGDTCLETFLYESSIPGVVPKKEQGLKDIDRCAIWWR